MSDTAPPDVDDHPAPLMATESDLPDGPTAGIVAVGYLSGTHVSNEFFKSMDAMRQVDAREGWNRIQHDSWFINQRSGVNVAMGRNRLVRKFLAMRDPAPEWLLMVDADMGWRPDSLETLLAAAEYPDRLVVGGLCAAFGQDPTSSDPSKISLVSTVFDMAPPLEGVELPAFQILKQRDVQRRAIREVYGTGAAFLLVHRQVLIDIAVNAGVQYPWFREIVAPDTREDIDWSDRNDYWVSEDLFFCLACHQAGHRVFVHTGVPIEHVKEVRLTESMWRQFPKAVQPA